MRRTAWLTALLALAGLASGCGNVCSAANCSGCCDAKGTCEQPSADYCGVGGEECASCGASDECLGGLCAPCPGGECPSLSKTSVSSTSTSGTVRGSTTTTSTTSSSSSGTTASHASAGTSGRTVSTASSSSGVTFGATGSSGSSAGYPGDCTPPPGYAGNNDGVGAYCTPSMPSCSGGGFCAAESPGTFGGTYDVCVEEGCTLDTECGVGGCCAFESGVGYCVPSGCGLCAPVDAGPQPQPNQCAPCSAFYPCQDGATCVTEGDAGYCARACNESTECAGGTECYSVESNPGQYCYPSDGTCTSYVRTLLSGGFYGELLGLVVDSSDLYFTASGGIYRLPLAGADGGAFEVVPITGAANSMAAASDGGTLFWTQNGDVFSAPKSGAFSPTTVVIGNASDSLQGVTVEGTNLYWCDQTAGLLYSGSIFGQEQAGSELASAPDCYGLTSTQGILYYLANSPSEEVWDISAMSDSPTPLFPGTGFLYGIATDGTSLFWTVQSTGTIIASVIGSGAWSTFVSGQDEPCGIAVDDTYVYWTNLGDGSIHAAYKPLPSFP